MCCCVSMKCYLIFISMDLMFQLGLGVFYFDFSIIKSSSCNAQHSYCATLYPFQLSNIGNCIFLISFQIFSNFLENSKNFSGFLKISHKFSFFLKILKIFEISQDFPICLNNFKIPEIFSKCHTLSN